MQPKEISLLSLSLSVSLFYLLYNLTFLFQEIASSGSLLTRENFKGCIRNVSIRNERRDWIDMDNLHNVLLSECLVTGNNADS